MTGPGTPDDDGPVLLDVTGLRCPLPVIRLARLARDLPAGATVRVLSTDPAAGPDLAAWCRMRGHTLLGQEPDGQDPDGQDPDGQDPDSQDPEVLVSLVRLAG